MNTKQSIKKYEATDPVILARVRENQGHESEPQSFLALSGKFKISGISIHGVFDNDASANIVKAQVITIPYL